jgi:hypothetical protein
MHDPLKGDKSFRAEDAEDVHEQVIQRSLIGYPEVREGMVTDRLHRGTPPVCGVILDTPGDLPGRAYSLTVGIDPYADEQPGIKGSGAGFAFDRLDIMVVGGKVDMPGKLSDRPDLMFVGYETFHIDRP